MTVPILEGLDGVQKMSKSLGNYIGIQDSPDDMFGKIMSVSDELMWRYFDLLSFRPLGELQNLRAEVAQGANPRDIKFQLAEELITRFHDAAAANAAREAFVARFRQGVLPDELPEKTVVAEGDGVPLPTLLRLSGLVQSSSEGMRMIGQGAVRIDGERVEDRGLLLAVGSEVVVQVGKRRVARVSVVAGSS